MKFVQTSASRTICRDRLIYREQLPGESREILPIAMKFASWILKLSCHCLSLNDTNQIIVPLSVPERHKPNYRATLCLWTTQTKLSCHSLFLHHRQRRTAVDRTPLDERSARRRDLYLTTHNTHNRQTSMPPGGIRTHNLSRRTAADLRLWTCGHWDRQMKTLLQQNLHVFQGILLRFISGRWIVTSVVRMPRIRGLVVLLSAGEWNNAVWHQLVPSDTTFSSASPLPGDSLLPMRPAVTTHSRSNLKNGLDLYAPRLTLNRQNSLPYVSHPIVLFQNRFFQGSQTISF